MNVKRKIQELWNSLEGECFVSKREMLLGLLTCVLAGIVLGAFLSPKKTITIGSNNTSNTGTEKKAAEE